MENLKLACLQHFLSLVWVVHAGWQLFSATYLLLALRGAGWLAVSVTVGSSGVGGREGELGPYRMVAAGVGVRTISKDCLFPSTIL